MTNILLAGGCSFTEEQDTKNYNNFDRWPKILANKLKLNNEIEKNEYYVNLARAGSSNQEISSTLFRYIVENYDNIKCVFVLWTDWYRVNFCFNKPGFSTIIFKDAKEEEAGRREGGEVSDDYISLVNKRLSRGATLDWYKKNPKFIDGLITPDDFVNYNLQCYKQIEIVCKYYKIPYFFMQGIDNIGDKLGVEKYSPLNKISTQDFSYESLLDALQKNKLQIDITRFIGWPPFLSGSRFLKKPTSMKSIKFDKETGKIKYSNLQRGFAINHFLLRYNLMISDTDLHPNKEGHEEIANIFFSKYNVE